MLGGLGLGEMVLIFAVLLLLFGAKRLPELASGMGQGIRDFKRSLDGLDEPVAPVVASPKDSVESATATRTADASQRTEPRAPEPEPQPSDRERDSRP